MTYLSSVVISAFRSSKSWYDGMAKESKPRRDPAPASASGPVGDDAQKKFGNAKAISSDQFFGQRDDNSVSVSLKVKFTSPGYA